MDESFSQIAATLTRRPHTLARLQELMRDAERKRAIGERIKALRERRGLTQPQLMEQIGHDRSRFRSLQNWEAGGGTSHENYERLAEALGCSYDYLVTGADVAPPSDDILARLDGLEEGLLDLRADVAELGVDFARDRTLRQKWQHRERGQDSSAVRGR